MASVNGRPVSEAFKGQQTAAKGVADVESQKATAEQPILQDLAAQQQREQQTFAEQRAKLGAQSDALFNAVRDKRVNPDQYLSNMSVGHRLMTGLGLLLGGIGGGIAGTGRNVGLEMLNKSIDADIEAQKTNISQANNVYRLAADRTNNLDAAHALAKADMFGIAQGKLTAIAGQYKGPEAQARASLLSADLEKQRQEWLTKAAELNAQQAQQYKLGKLGYDLQVRSAQAQDAVSEISRKAARGENITAEERSVLPEKQQELTLNMPDGTFRLATNTAAHSKAAELQEGLHSIDQDVRQLQALAHVSGGGKTLDPATRKRSQDLVNNVILGMGELKKLKRFTEPEEELYKKLVADPTAIFSFDSKNVQTLQDLGREISQSRDAMLGAYVVGGKRG